MSGRKAMTLMLTEAEMAALEKLSESKDMTKGAVVRKPPRLYHALDEKLARGERHYSEDEVKKEKPVLVVL